VEQIVMASIPRHARSLLDAGAYARRARFLISTSRAPPSYSNKQAQRSLVGHNGKLATVIDQIEHGHHVFGAYWKHAFLKRYEKSSRYLRDFVPGSVPQRPCGFSPAPTDCPAGSVRYPGIQIHDTRIIRLPEVLLSEAVLATFELSARS
jgi:hypothetical protein